MTETIRNIGENPVEQKIKKKQINENCKKLRQFF